MDGTKRQEGAPPLDRRQQRILRFVVEQFVRTGHPVGSRVLSRSGEEQLSPATIRNTMADLEDLGYLAQPHTSAGRVPTDLGYRYYVDGLMPPSSIPLAEQQQIGDFFSSFGGMVTTILEQTSRLLSQYSHYIGIVTTPRFDSIVFRHISFVRQAPGKVLVIFVAAGGLVFNKLLTVEGDYNQEFLEKAGRWVVDHFAGLSLPAVRRRIEELLQHERVQYDLLERQALFFSRASFAGGFDGEDLYVEGTTNLVTAPDFAARERIEEILRAIEEKSALLRLLDGCMSGGGVQVVIGSENELKEITGCSLVAGAYQFPDGSRGSIAILGPKRMPYPRTIYLVDYISKQINRIAG